MTDGKTCAIKGRFSGRIKPVVLPMGEDKRQLFRSLGLLSSIGISMVAATCIGLYLGITLDDWLGTKPWMTIIWLGIGIAAGFRNIYILTRRALREENGPKDSDGA